MTEDKIGSEISSEISSEIGAGVSAEKKSAEAANENRAAETEKIALEKGLHIL